MDSNNEDIEDKAKSNNNNSSNKNNGTKGNISQNYFIIFDPSYFYGKILKKRPTFFDINKSSKNTKIVKLNSRNDSLSSSNTNNKILLKGL